MIINEAQLEWVRRPVQARSQQTLERLLDAAEAIIGEKGLDHVTVADVAKRAGSSVGAFYSRFSDKEGLMRCVFERFNDQALATTEAVLQPERWDGIPLEDVLETVMLFTQRIMNEKRGLIVALLVRTAHDPSLGALGERLQDQITTFMAALVAHRGEQIDHSHPSDAIGLAVWMVLSALEVRTLYAAAGVDHHDDTVVAHELTRMVMRYLGLIDQQGSSAPRSQRRRKDSDALLGEGTNQR